MMMYIGGIVHALSNYLLACGMGACLGTFGVAALMSCSGLSIFYCISGVVVHDSAWLCVVCDLDYPRRLPCLCPLG